MKKPYVMPNLSVRRTKCSPVGAEGRRRGHVCGLSERPGHDAKSDVHPFQISRVDITGLDLWTKMVAQAADVFVGFWLAGLLPGDVFNEFLPATCLINAWR